MGSKQTCFSRFFQLLTNFTPKNVHFFPSLQNRLYNISSIYDQDNLDKDYKPRTRTTYHSMKVHTIPQGFQILGHCLITYKFVCIFYSAVIILLDAGTLICLLKKNALNCCSLFISHSSTPSFFFINCYCYKFATNQSCVNHAHLVCI